MSDTDILALYQLPDGRMEAKVRLPSGLVAVRGVERVELAADVLTADGGVEPLGVIATTQDGSVTLPCV